jgi:general secretion pathway protein L
MSLLRIYAPLSLIPPACAWSLLEDGREPVTGHGPLATLPRAERVQLVVPATDGLLIRARLPREALANRAPGGALLAFAVEERLAGDPEANHVAPLNIAAIGESVATPGQPVGAPGRAGPAPAGDENAVPVALGVLDKAGLARWRAALESAGIVAYEVHSETLLLPLTAGGWSLAWNGTEGFFRSGSLSGGPTDDGDRLAPPLALELALAEAGDARPQSIALYTMADTASGNASQHAAPEATPDFDAWGAALGVPVRSAGTWDWRRAPASAGTALTRERRRWQGSRALWPALRAAAIIAGAALALHAVLLAVDWARLAHEQQALRGRMEARFRAEFPQAVAVADPALQMRRQLAEARHQAGETDAGDFLPLIDKVAAATRGLPRGALHTVDFDTGRMSLEFPGLDEAALTRVAQALRDANLRVELPPRAAGQAGMITVRAL